MNEKRRAKVQEAAKDFLEPGERVEAEVAGWKAKSMWETILLVGPVGMMVLGRGRDYVLTDRNVYSCQVNAMTNLPKKVLVKRPVGSGALELTKTGLALDGSEQLFVGKLIRSRAQELYDREQQLASAMAGGPAPAEPAATA